MRSGRVFGVVLAGYASASKWSLFGGVREAAQVFVNGKAAGAVWKAPFEVEVTGLLLPGENAIRVVVANLALNTLAKGPLPDYKELTAKYGEKFQAQDMVSVRSLPAGSRSTRAIVAMANPTAQPRLLLQW